jgi:parvulin-like peptidyl-prolyl isomerase
MTMRKLLIPFLPLALLAQTSAPQPKPAATQAAMAPAPAAPKASPAPAAAPEPPDSEIIAYLGKRSITYGDFTSWLKVMAGPRAESIRKAAPNRAQAMKQYLDTQVLSAKSTQEHLQNTREYKELAEAMTQQARVRVLLDEERSGSDGQKLKQKAENPSDEEVQAYFKANSERYAVPERFTARHILVAIKGAAGAGDKGLPEPEAKAKAEQLLEQIRQGKPFEDVAKEASDDPGSKANGGLYKDIPFGRFAKEFEAAVRSQEIGKLYDPVKTAFGYHLILVEARSPKQAGNFEQVKETVRKQLIPERRDQLTKAFLEQAKKDVGFREAPTALTAPAPAKP